MRDPWYLAYCWLLISISLVCSLLMLMGRSGKVAWGLPNAVC